MTSIDPVLVERFTGQRRVVTVEAATAEMDVARAVYNRIQKSCDQLRARIEDGRRREASLKIRLWFAGLPGRFGVEGWIILLVLSAIIALSASLMVLSLAVASSTALVAACVAPFLLMCFSPFLSAAKFGILRDELRKTVDTCSATRQDLAASEPMLFRCRERYLESQHLRAGLLRAQEFPLNRLLNADLSQMSGPQFEAYLAEVFRFLGYDVRTTGQSGDQGVDLVVAFGGVAAAVQAKCYGGTVGNAAVQQVYTGMRLYACQKCVVIASSSFTRSAREAANAVGCLLISRDEIPLLIRGQLVI
jgi:hypothetical protein